MSNKTNCINVFFVAFFGYFSGILSVLFAVDLIKSTFPAISGGILCIILMLLIASIIGACDNKNEIEKNGN
jgi:tetrahydromethanopterin S-methyltransferase subunit C